MTVAEMLALAAVGEKVFELVANAANAQKAKGEITEAEYAAVIARTRASEKRFDEHHAAINSPHNVG